MRVVTRAHWDSDVWFLQALKGRKKYDAVVGMGHAASSGYQVRALMLALSCSVFHPTFTRANAASTGCWAHAWRLIRES